MGQPEVDATLKSLAMARSRFNYGLECVPDDRLDWSPGGLARTPLQLADRLTTVLRFVCHLLTERAFPTTRVVVEPATSREVAKQQVDAVAAEVVAIIQRLTEDDMDATMPAPWSDAVPVRLFVFNLPYLYGYFQGQLNMLQLAYGDDKANIPPGYGTECP